MCEEAPLKSVQLTRNERLIQTPAFWRNQSGKRSSEAKDEKTGKGLKVLNETLFNQTQNPIKREQLDLERVVSRS